MNNRKSMTERRVLVTAGSTWTKIDDVRVIANIFTGNTGIAIARHFAEMGVDTTLLFNPKINRVKPEPGLELVQYVTYHELKAKMQEEIESGKYDVVIHSAAVSDYGEEVVQLIEVTEAPELTGNGLRVFREVTDLPGKIKSNLPEMVIAMTKTEKIVDFVKKWDPKIYLVKFKLEVGLSYEELVAVAKTSMDASQADLIVANDLRGSRNGIPSALILGSEEIKEIEKRKFLPTVLFNTVQWELRKRG